MSWNDGLTGVALQIAQTHDTPLRVMAGPGTGKSFAMKRRVARLLEEGMPPEQILAVTFTRTAAAGLVADLAQLGVAGCEDIWCGTLHAYCFSLLSKEDVFNFLQRVPRPLMTFNKSGVMRFEAAPLLEDLCGEAAFGGKRACTKRVRAFEAAWARLQSDDPGWPLDPTDHQFHDALLRWLRFHQAMLIGELVPEALRYLRNNPAAPALSTFSHVIVDEYQDLNRAEQELIGLLASNGSNAIVGDVDQSIYSFRHANPEGIVQFAHAYPATHDETLAECRRCPRRVVTLADHLIRENYPGAAAPRLQPKADNPDGEVHIIQWQSIAAEANGLAEYIQHLTTNRGYLPGDILVLSPRRLLGYGIRDALRNLNVPTHSFYHEEALEADEAQEAFATLKVLSDPQDRVALRWWLGYGDRAWRRGEYRILRNHCEQTGLSPRDALEQLRTGQLALNGTASLVARYATLSGRVNALNGLTISDLAGTLFPDAQDWSRPLREAAMLAVPSCDTAAKLLDKLTDGIIQPQMPEEGDFVRIMSLHKSKGLTAKVAIVAGCIHGLIPFVDGDATPAEAAAIHQEQRRLFYVAITRCREILVMSSITQVPRALAYRIGAIVRPGRTPDAPTIASPFLDELGPTRPAPRRGQAWIAGGFV
ncbi:MAG: ATP-dependent helicase [Bacillota bacterium]